MGQRALDDVEVVSAVLGPHLRRAEFYSGGDISFARDVREFWLQNRTMRSRRMSEAAD